MSHNHDGQIIASKPSQLTQFIQWMILDGLGRGLMGSMSCILQHAGSMGGADRGKFSSANPTFDPESRCPTTMMAKSSLQNHPNSPDSSNR
jgi:hypothetical protein